MESVITDPRRVCLVAPTGAGKTVMGRAIARRLGRVLWLAHRQELIDQAPPECIRRTVQGLLASGERIDCDAVVWDECHHSVSPEWRSLVRADVPLVGLTATPQRGDGAPLGDVFDRLVVAAQYSELVRDGHLSPARVFAPHGPQRGLAMSVGDAVERWFPRSQCVVFCESIEAATATGYPVVSADTPAAERADLVAAYRSGEVRVLANVFALTEGFDAPATAGVILARGFGHVSSYLQACGRALRPAPGKTEALVIDLVGDSLRHGPPTADRDYSLDGDGIVKASRKGVRQCQACYHVWLPGPPTCPNCGAVTDRKGRGVTDTELREAVFSGDPAAIYRRLRSLGMAPWALATRFRALTGHLPPWDLTRAEIDSERRRLECVARDRGYRPGWAYVQLKNIGLRT